MAGDARAETLSAMEAAVVAAGIRCICHSAYSSTYVFDPRCEHHHIIGLLPALLDAIPAPVLARYAIERDGMEQVGWLYATDQRFDLRYTLTRDEPTAHRHRQPVYRLAASSMVQAMRDLARRLDLDAPVPAAAVPTGGADTEEPTHGG